jgi:hypothetical protein
MSENRWEEKNRKLLAQYPVIAETLKTIGYDQKNPESSLRIKVERMDSNLLYYVGERVDGEQSFLRGRNDLVGTKFEHVMYWDKSYVTLGWLIWDQGFDRINLWFQNRTREGIDQLQWITKVMTIDWYKENNSEACRSNARLGEQVSTCHYITLYLLPKKGIHDLLARTDMMVNVRVNTRDLIKGVLHQEGEYQVFSRGLDELVAKFTFGVFVRGLDRIIIENRLRGMSGKFGDVTLRSWHMCGRIKMTLERGQSRLTIIACDDDNPRAGLDGIEATFPEAKRMIETVIYEWKKLPKLSIPKAMKAGYAPDDDTSYCGLTNPKPAEKQA